MNTKVLFIAAAAAIIAGAFLVENRQRDKMREDIENTALEFSQNDVKSVREHTLDKDERILALRRIHHTAVSNVFSLEQLGLTEDEFEKLMEELVLTDEVTRQEAGVKLRNE